MKLSDLEIDDKPLGRGKFSTVFACRVRDTGEKCALKCMDKRRLVQLGGDAAREIYVHTQLTAKHAPYCLELRMWFEDEKCIYLLLEYAAGGDLYTRLGKRGVSAALAAKWTLQLTLALQACERAGFIHRDIKPENILLTGPEGDVRLSDFGWCIEATRVRERAGTIDYQSPEQLRGESYDSSIDRWALGLLVYEMLHGRTPFEKESIADTKMAILGDDSGDRIAFDIGCDIHAQQLVHGLLRRDSTARLALQDVLDHPFLQKHRSTERQVMAESSSSSSSSSLVPRTMLSIQDTQPSSPAVTSVAVMTWNTLAQSLCGGAASFPHTAADALDWGEAKQS